MKQINKKQKGKKMLNHKNTEKQISQYMHPKRKGRVIRNYCWCESKSQGEKN